MWNRWFWGFGVFSGVNAGGVIGVWGLNVNQIQL